MTLTRLKGIAVTSPNYRHSEMLGRYSPTLLRSLKKEERTHWCGFNDRLRVKKRRQRNPCCRVSGCRLILRITWLEIIPVD